MDLLHLEGPSSLHTGKMQQKSRQAHRVETVDIAKSVQQYNYSRMQPQSPLNIQQKQHLHQTAEGLHPESDAHSELRQSAETLLLCKSPVVVQKAENTVMELTTEAINLMKYQVEQKVQYFNVDHKVQELCQQDGIAKMRSLEIQMENEDLSQEKDLHLRSSGGLALRVKNMLDICGLLQEHYDKLRLTAEQVEKLRSDLHVRFALLSNDLKIQYENLKALTVEHENNMVNLKHTVGKERELRINEIIDANSNYQKQDNILCEKMLILKSEGEKYSSLNIQDEELDRNITEEELNLSEKLKHAHETVQSFACKNETLETDTHSYKSKRKDLKKSLHSITVERDCFKKQAVDLEELFASVSSEEKILSQELDSVKERLSHHERESCEKHNQKDTYETENLDLLQRKSEFEDKHKDVNRKLEDSRIKHDCLTQDLTDLTMNLERIRSEYEITSDSYRSELSDLKSALDVVNIEADSKRTKLKDQTNTVKAFQQEFEEEDALMKSLELKLQSLKASAADEVEKMESLSILVEEKKTRLEEASKLLVVKQSEVGKLKKEVERKHKEHADIKKEMLMAVNKTREETKIVKEEREKRDSEHDKKRQEIMEGLRECREASLKQAEEKEAELNEQRKDNCMLKEKLNNITSHKESIERESEIQKKMLECKIKQLKLELENESTPSTIRNISQISEQDSSSIKANLKPPLPRNTYNQAFVKTKSDDQVISDSDHSSIEFSDLVQLLHSGKKGSELQHSDSAKRRRFETCHKPGKVLGPQKKWRSENKFMIDLNEYKL
ncbi:ankycorbin isoform X2 [Cryptotermes secundus]|uniref:ankycorbin isoform X2 n=1 Tax=Cryptotermes secundus TaxID=105785 RepID=UPI000CD7AAC1|nr:ankycorbin isoform X2 [Cryptotermes secundus]